AFFYIAKKFLKFNKKIIFFFFLIFTLKVLVIVNIESVFVFPDEKKMYDCAISRAGEDDAYGEMIYQQDGCYLMESYYLAFLEYAYKISPTYALIPRLINLILYAFSALLVFKLSLILFKSESIAKTAMIFFLIFPATNFWSLFILRETLMAGVFLAIFLFLILGLEVNKFFLLGSVFFLIVSFALRDLVWLIAVISFFIVKIFIFFINSTKKTKTIFIIIIFLLLLISTQIKGVPEKTNFLVKQISDKRNANDLGNFSFFENLKFASVTDILKFLPISFVYAVLSPLIPDYNNVYASVFFLFEAVPLYFILASIFFSVNLFKEEKFFYIIIFCLIYLTFIFVINGNIQTGLRYRSLLLPFLIILAAPFLNRIRIFNKFFID
ncbi:MAG: hypothetical protein Q8O84_00035, partial [Nanoarchaeota archaeon]|nr:hypothetical protein [Nanoarchaeota archaeon]